MSGGMDCCSQCGSEGTRCTCCRDCGQRYYFCECDIPPIHKAPGCQTLSDEEFEKVVVPTPEEFRAALEASMDQYLGHLPAATKEHDLTSYLDHDQGD